MTFVPLKGGKGAAMVEGCEWELMGEYSPSPTRVRICSNSWPIRDLSLVMMPTPMRNVRTAEPSRGTSGRVKERSAPRRRVGPKKLYVLTIPDSCSNNWIDR